MNTVDQAAAIEGQEIVEGALEIIEADAALAEDMANQQRSAMEPGRSGKAPRGNCEIVFKLIVAAMLAILVR